MCLPPPQSIGFQWDWCIHVTIKFILTNLCRGESLKCSTIVIIRVGNRSDRVWFIPPSQSDRQIPVLESFQVRSRVSKSGSIQASVRNQHNVEEKGPIPIRHSGRVPDHYWDMKWENRPDRI